MIPRGLYGAARSAAPVAGGGGPLNPEYIGQAINTSGASTYSWSGVDIGEAAENRVIVVAFQARVSSAITTEQTITSASIAGGAAAVDYYKHVTPTESPDTSYYGSAGFIRRAVPTGTTADISVTTSSACLRAGISVYTFDDIATLLDVDWAYSYGPETGLTRTLDTASDGALLFAANYRVGFILDAPTQDHTTVIASGYSHLTGSTATSGPDFTAEFDTGSKSGSVVALASYSPTP